MAALLLCLCAFLAGGLFGAAEARPQSNTITKQYLPTETLDYSQWAFEEQGSIRLDTGWRVFRDRLLSPEQLAGTDCKGANSGYASERIDLPDLWGPAATTSVSTGHGVATYCIELMVPKTEERLAVRFGNLRTISSILAVYPSETPGQITTIPLYRNGDPFREPTAESLSAATPVVALPYRGETVRLIVQLANYVHKQGGVVEVPVLNLYSRLDAQQRRDASLPMALVIVLAMISVGAFIVGNLTGNMARYAVFALLTAASAFRVFFVSDIIWDFLPHFSLTRKYDLEYLSLFLVLPAYYAFVVMLLGEGKDWLISKIVYVVSGTFAGFALFAAPFFAPGVVTLLREPFQAFWIVSGFYIAFMIIRAVYVSRGEKMEAVFVLAAAVVMAGYEFLSALGMAPYSMEWAQLLVLMVTVLHARAFATNFRNVESERDELNKSLMGANAALETKANDLKFALNRAEESSRAKNEFLATMSHELRTPLNAIIGFSEVMEREAFGPMENDHYKDYVKDISGSGRHLLSIVNDILDLARIESGNDELYEDEFEPEVVAGSMVRIVGPQAALKNVTCTLECEDDLPLLFADQRKVKQILINLLNNAIKFNVQGGTVTLSVKMLGDCLNVSVADTGIGMDKNDIPRALARFQQVDGELARRYEGLGIGLSLVDALVEQHEANLNIESELGQGTCVSVTFPQSRTHLPVRAEAILKASDA